MFTFLLVVHAIIAAALVAVILMQRSEGGGLAGGGSPAGLMSARGASNFLTRTTAILATVFVALSIGMAALASINRKPVEIDASLAKNPVVPATAPLATPVENGAAVPAEAAAPSVPIGGGAAAPVADPQELPAAALPAAPKPAPVERKPVAAPPKQTQTAPLPAAPKKTEPANTAAPIAVPSDLVSPPTPSATRPDPQPDGR